MSKTYKIAVPSLAPGGLNAEGTTRFGRCAFFTIIQIENGDIKEVEIINNDASGSMGGAGPFAAQLMSDHHVEAIIGAHYGPNAARALNHANIKMYGPYPGLVQEIVDAFLDNKLQLISDATVSSHSGL